MQVVKLIKAYVLSAPDPRPRGVWKPMSPLDKSDYNDNYHYLHRFTVPISWFLNIIILTMNQRPLRERTFPGGQQGKHKQSLEHLIVLETK